MPTDLSELSLLVSSRLPIIVVESDDEARVIALFKRLQQDRKGASPRLDGDRWTDTIERGNVVAILRQKTDRNSWSYSEQP